MSYGIKMVDKTSLIKNTFETCKKNIANNKKHFTIILSLAIISLITITWFRGEHLINGGDYELPLSPLKDLYYRLFVWQYTYGTESANSVANLFPWNSFFAFCEFLGLSLINSEKLLFYLLFFLQGLFMYIFTINFIQGESRYVSGFFSALLYMFNLYTLQFRWKISISSMFVYVFLPVLFLFFYKGYILKKQRKKYLFYFGLTSLFIASSSTTPAYVIPIFIILFTYLVFNILVNKKYDCIIDSIKYYFLIVSVYFCFNLWWILPILGSGTIKSRFLQVYFDDWATYTINSLKAESLVASIINVLRIQGHWGFQSTHQGVPYYPYAQIYLTPFYILISVLIPVIAFSSLKYVKDNNFLLYMNFLSIFGVFLMKGIHPPLGNLFEYFFFTVPILRVFRMTHDKFGLILLFGYAYTFGYSVGKIFLLLRNKLIIKLNNYNLNKFIDISLILVLFIPFFIIYPFPFWTGDIIPPDQTTLRGWRIDIPDYYYDEATWFNNKTDDFKIFELPFRKGVGGASFTYDWGYTGALFEPHLITKPFITHRMTPTATILEESYDLLRSEQTDNVGSIWGLFGIKYIVFHNDYDSSAQPGQVDPLNNITNWLTSQQGISLTKKIGQLDIYSNNNFVPRLFLSSTLINTNNDVITASDLLFALTNFKEEYPVVLDVPTLTNIELGYNISAKYLIKQEAETGYFNNTGWGIWKLFIGTYQNNDDKAAIPYENETISYRINIPENGLWDVYATVRWDGDRGTLKYKINDGIWSNGSIPFNGTIGDISNYYYAEIKLGQSYIESGNHTITFINTDPKSYKWGYQNIDNFYLKGPVVKDSLLEIESKLLNPTAYSIKINNSQPCFLVFSDGYHSGWKLLEKQSFNLFDYFTSSNFIDTVHFQGNGYMNVWYIKETGFHDIILYFQPQVYFYWGLIGSTFFILFFYIVLRYK